VRDNIQFGRPGDSEVPRRQRLCVLRVKLPPAVKDVDRKFSKRGG